MTVDKSELGPLLARGRTADIYPLGRDAVIKVLRSGFPSDLIQIEADKTRTVKAAGVPAPRILDVTEVAGRPALVVERVHGESLLGRVLQQPHKLVPLARLLGDLHADLAAVRIEKLPALRTKLAERIDNVAALSTGLKQLLLNKLSGLPGEDGLCHGDFHPDNVILSTRGPIIIDWLDATHGPATADAARSHLLLSLAAPTQDLALVHRVVLALERTLFKRTYFARYRSRRDLDADALAAWTPIVAAARLAEDVDGEAELLCSEIRKRTS